MGISPQTLNKWFDRNTFDTDVLIQKFPDINPFWMVTGEGEVFLANVAGVDNNTIKGDRNVVIGTAAGFEKIITSDKVEIQNPASVSDVQKLQREIELLKEENAHLREMVQEYKTLYLEYKNR